MSKDFKYTKLIKLVLLIVLLLGLVLMILQKDKLIKLFQNRTNKITSTTPHSEKEVITKIGKEEVTKQDINNIKRSLYDIKNEEELLDEYTKESIILQAAAKEKLIELPASFFSEKFKDNVDTRQLRTDYLKKAEENYLEKSSIISGSVISVFFFNQRYLVSPNKAESVAYNLITNAYKDITEKNKNPDEVIKNLSSNKELKNIDWNAQFNTGYSFINQPVWRLTTDPLYLETISKMPVTSDNQIVSEIVRYPGSKEQFPAEDFKENEDPFLFRREDNGYYYFFVLNKKTPGYIKTFDQWKADKLKEYKNE